MSRKRKYSEAQRDAFAYIYLLQNKVTIDRIANYFCMMNNHGKPNGSLFRQQSRARLEELNSSLWVRLDAEAAMRSSDDKKGCAHRDLLASHFHEFFTIERQRRLLPVLRRFLRDKSLNERTEKILDLPIAKGVLSSDEMQDVIIDPLANNIAYENEGVEIEQAERTFSYESIDSLVGPENKDVA